jgi:hypothetical protein
MGNLVSSTPQTTYRYTTLELKILVYHFREHQIKPSLLASLLRQVPYQVNYSYDSTTKKICRHHQFIPSEDPIKTHLQLKGLTHSCAVRLTKNQHDQINELKRVLASRRRIDY